MVETVQEENLFVPTFRQNRPGMQPGPVLSPGDQEAAENVWRYAAQVCVDASKSLADLGVHKQWANRLTEWFGYINVLVTSTDWENFFKLRLETDLEGYPVPQDEMYELACKMNEALRYSQPRELQPGEWHLPFITAHDRSMYSIEDQKKLSSARCASISYETVDGQEMTPDKAFAINKKLSEKEHWSPFEHQAMADPEYENKFAHANYNGWAQYRHLRS
jgi:hypothetical protein